MPTAIPTVNAGGTIQSVQWGNVVKAFIDYLHTGRTVVSSTYVGNADATTTADTFGNVDATNIKITITPTSSRCRVSFQFFALGPAANCEFDIYSSGLNARFGDSTHGIIPIIGARYVSMNVSALFTGLTPNTSQYFTLQFRSVTSSQTTTVYNNAVSVTMIAEEC